MGLTCHVQIVQVRVRCTPRFNFFSIFHHRIFFVHGDFKDSIFWGGHVYLLDDSCDEKSKNWRESTSNSNVKYTIEIQYNKKLFKVF